jgi:hypothetical protein
MVNSEWIVIKPCHEKGIARIICVHLLTATHGSQITAHAFSLIPAMIDGLVRILVFQGIGEIIWC